MNKINKYNYNFYLTNTEPCPYLTNRDEKKIFLIMDDINKSNEYEHLIKSGFRRSHNILYNQVCADCNLCKSIRINVNNFNHEIISMGHRNPQGLFLDYENNFILETEHGPRGGDEINLIPLDQIKNNKILNYGWAIASAGEHYVVTDEKLKIYCAVKYKFWIKTVFQMFKGVKKLNKNIFSL